MSSPNHPTAKKTTIPAKPIIGSADSIHHKAFNNSLIPNIIFIVPDGRIIQANHAACKLLGYSKKEILTKKREDIFDASEEEYKNMLKERNEEGSVKADISILGRSGKRIPCEITSVIFNDANGILNSILSIVDLRERILRQQIVDVETEKADQRAEENIHWIESIAKTSYDIIWDWNIATNIISFGKNYEKVFGYRLEETKITIAKWMKHFKMDERKAIKKEMDRMLGSKKNSWEGTYPFTTADGTASEVTSRANILRDDQGEITRVIGVIHDVSNIRKLEESHEQAIIEKERQIIDAIVESKEMERINIGQELHDNINQLLGASMLYLNMARKDEGNQEIYLIHSTEYTQTAIDEIRQLSKGMNSGAIKDYGLCGAIEHMTGDIMESSPVKIHYSSDYWVEDRFNEKFKLNAYRILQEQLNNIIKHAKASNIYIALSRTDTVFTVSIADDGIGYDTSKKRKGVGIGNIISRAAIYKGTAEFQSEAQKGCKLVVTFPITDLCLE